MPHPKKKQRLTGDDANYLVETAPGRQMTASAGDLSVDVLADILGFLGGAKDIMQKRRVCKKWKEAVKKTIVPPTAFWVHNVERYNAVRVMTRAMPNLQQMSIGSLGYGSHKYNEGEDPDEELTARTANWTTYDIEIISNFRQLRDLAISRGAPLNGRYPFLFNFPLLQKLFINSAHLIFDLEMLAGLPLLKELNCESNTFLTGNINSLRVLKDTLEKVTIKNCWSVGGNFMDLADFPQLKELDFEYTAVTGDIRDIGNDFSSLEYLDLPHGVYGGKGYEFQRISDGPDVVRAVYLLKKQRSMLKMNKRWFVKLSEDSPDWYDSVDEDDDDPPLDVLPFRIHIVEAGSRVGYRWASRFNNPCEVNWLDPEPDRESSDYGKYIEESQEIERRVGFYRGFHQPPTEEEYRRLLDRFEEEHRAS